MNAPVAVVTGAGSGIGRAIALELSHLGMHVVLVGRRHRPLAETAALLPRSSELLTADISRANDARSIVDLLRSKGPGLDVLVNNAAVVHPAPLGNATDEHIEELFQTNIMGPLRLVNLAWPLLQHAGRTSGRSSVVNISSIATIDPFPELYAYAASKAGLNVMVRSIHNQGNTTGVRAFAIAPGSVETPMLRAVVSENVVPTARTLAPAAIATVVRECVQGLRDHASGEVIVLPSP